MWLERCRDGSYAVNALRCDVWVVCTCIAVCIVACFIGFRGSVFFGGRASLHDLFFHFLAKCFFCNLFWGVFFGGGNKCVGVNVICGWCWNGTCLRKLCVVIETIIYGVVGISICTPSHFPLLRGSSR